LNIPYETGPLGAGVLGRPRERDKIIAVMLYIISSEPGRPFLIAAKRRLERVASP